MQAMFKSFIITMLFLCGLLAACNTMEGIGRDVEKAGDSLEDSASKHKNY